MMKITVGLGSIDDYISYVEAGADEMFCGYVPEWWMERYDIESPLNRREVRYYNVQIGSYSELEILQEMVRAYGVPVSITLNALYYKPQQYEDVCRVITECMDAGFYSFIIADIAFMEYLQNWKNRDKMRLIVSGEMGEINAWTMRLFADMHVDRAIFHRKMTFSGMQACHIEEIKEYEAFILNEKCHFHGGFCNSMHCDELPHMCKVPYRLEVYKNFISPVTSSSGCGLCALQELQKAGITHLKVVGRGNYADDMVQDILLLKKALQLLEKVPGTFSDELRKTLFPDGCSHNCYYFR